MFEVFGHLSEDRGDWVQSLAQCLQHVLECLVDSLELSQFPVLRGLCGYYLDCHFYCRVNLRSLTFTWGLATYFYVTLATLGFLLFWFFALASKFRIISWYTQSEHLSFVPHLDSSRVCFVQFRRLSGCSVGGDAIFATVPVLCLDPNTGQDVSLAVCGVLQLTQVGQSSSSTLGSEQSFDLCSP